MATFKILHDQENKLPELRQKQGGNVMAAQQKRAVLGAIDNNKLGKNVAKGKQALKDTETHRGCNNENRKNLVAPVVPVAQFASFKVYEDDEIDRARIDQQLRLISKSNVYKGTAEDRFITKTELAEIEKKKQAEQLDKATDLARMPTKTVTLPQIPMSIEKINDENVPLAEEIVQQSANLKDRFFEMAEYREDIYKYLREHELRHRAKAGYILKQPDVTDNMRAILVDWLVEVVEEYRMHTETLYLAVNFIDRFLSYMSVVRAKLQLVGTAAMFIAAKYEEIFPPDVNEFVYITDDTYDKHQVIRMEHLILRVLGFDLSVATPLTFINSICVSSKLSEKTMYLAMYLSELALLEVEPYLQFLPSMIAASAVALARHTLGDEAWNEVLEKNTGYSLKQLQLCIEFLYGMFIKAPVNPQHAIPDKYKNSKYLQVSQISPNTKRIPID